MIRAPKHESDQMGKGHRRHSQSSKKTDIYCPHSYLEVKFAETLDPGEKVNEFPSTFLIRYYISVFDVIINLILCQRKWRQNYMRKVTPTEPNVITLQDVKDLVLFLLLNPISVEFVNFVHEPVVDRFLRSLIIYFQYYIEIWEDLCQKRAAVSKKASNPLAKGGRKRQSEELDDLRSLVGREYCSILIGAENTLSYHHIVSTNKSLNDEPSGQSQGEKDLRIYETLIRIAHKVVWIALQRKHSALIGS